VEEELGRVVGAGDVVEAEVDSHSDQGSEFGAEEPFPEAGVDPLEAVQVHQAVGGSESHPGGEENDSSVPEALVESEPIV
jgi:hypothetical protein